ncbi:MAG: hypothetical protein CBE20_02870 [Gammaproteobacteria bacterium TMED260]|jgi:hypothetical protein|nr:hypothetical protein [Gammaproteobacteria bacterium]OUX34002.1 MAG: hypothetical protein CBE20_02870 [Gammaproteobacteria bacterium TMED260]
MRFSLAMFLVLSGFVFGLLFSTRYALALYLSSLGESLGESTERAIARDREIAIKVSSAFKVYLNSWSA